MEVTDELLDEIERKAYQAPRGTWEIFVVSDKAKAMVAEVRRLRTRHESHLRTIANLSRDSVTPAEADELRGHIATLMAEVGSLRASLRSARSKSQRCKEECQIWERAAWYWQREHERAAAERDRLRGAVDRVRKLIMGDSGCTPEALHHYVGAALDARDDEWRDASGLLNGGDPGGVEPRHMTEFVNACISVINGEMSRDEFDALRPDR